MKLIIVHVTNTNVASLYELDTRIAGADAGGVAWVASHSPMQRIE